ncbi:phage tail protein [Thaumasiovibrio subtropicus]|uniref:phage tail protein n=1 Tax=Thaumasiovibrio subtropicus TaxID=1891207 RepID=UPI000B3577CF|nr:tail fiber protein [Thaumasiovibrio subtropicus]
MTKRTQFDKFKMPMFAAGVLLAAAVPQQSNAACSPDAYIGSICATAATYCPRNYAMAYGQLMSIADNTALYSLLGCQFGGDCRSTFALPDLRGRSAVGTGTGLGLPPVALAGKIGTPDKILTVDELPAHSHTATATQAAGTTSFFVSAFDSNGSSPTPSSTNNALHTAAKSVFAVNDDAKIYGPGTGNLVELQAGGSYTPGLTTVVVGNTGGNSAFSLQDPALGLTHCIAITGLYPPRT